MVDVEQEIGEWNEEYLRISLYLGYTIPTVNENAVGISRMDSVTSLYQIIMIVIHALKCSTFDSKKRAVIEQYTFGTLRNQ